MQKPVIAITTGEPAGIGPEISIRGAYRCLDTVIPVLIGDYALLEKTAAGIDHLNFHAVFSFCCSLGHNGYRTPVTFVFYPVQQAVFYNGLQNKVGHQNAAQIRAAWVNFWLGGGAS